MMKQFAPTAACLVFAACASPAFAATTFLGGDIMLGGNWDNGLPDSIGNLGTVSVNGTIGNTGAGAGTTATGLFIEQTGGTISPVSFQGSELDNVTWTLTSGQLGDGTLRLVNGSVVTVNGGLLGVTSGRDLSVDSTSSVTINAGGSAILDDDTGIYGSLTINGGNVTTGNGSGNNFAIGGTLTINSGVLDTSDTARFGSDPIGGGGTINFNGGTTTINRWSFKGSAIANLGGTSAGTVTANDWGNGLYTNADDRQRDNNININFLSGTQMTVTLGASARALDFTNNSTDDPTTLAWAEALWGEDQLLFNGQSSTDLGDLSWADATNSAVGLGGGEYFVFTAAGSFGGTLTLAVPEPSSLALLGLGGLCVVRRRRG